MAVLMSKCVLQTWAEQHRNYVELQLIKFHCLLKFEEATNFIHLPLVMIDNMMNLHNGIQIIT
jgi:hypothetical protein